MSSTRPVMPRINYASSMMVEDHLKVMMSLKKERFWRIYDNEFLPRATHSVFGDFPSEMVRRNKTPFSAK